MFALHQACRMRPSCYQFSSCSVRNRRHGIAQPHHTCFLVLPPAALIHTPIFTQLMLCHHAGTLLPGGGYSLQPTQPSSAMGLLQAGAGGLIVHSAFRTSLVLESANQLPSARPFHKPGSVSSLSKPGFALWCIGVAHKLNH